MSTSKSSVAQELIDAIINLCSDNRSSLVNLSLVSQRMRETSARHLYSDFTFNGETDSPTMEELAQILTTSPHLALNIRSLRVNLDFLYSSSMLPHSSEESVELKLSSSCLIFSRVHRIERLTLWRNHDFETENLSLELQTPAFETYQWPLLTHLTIYGSIPILPVMGVHNPVKSLAVNASYCSQRMWNVIEAEHSQLVRLQELIVHYMSDDVYGRELFGSHSPIDLSQLRALELRPQRILADGLFPRLLDCVSPTLEVFHLFLGGLSLHQAMPTLLRLPLPRLHTFQIALPALPSSVTDTSKENTQRAIDFTVSLLEGLHHNTPRTDLTAVTIRVLVGRVNPESIRAWLSFRGLDLALTRIAEQGRLQEIKIEFSAFRSRWFSEDFWKTLLEADFQGISHLKGVVQTLVAY